MALIITLGLVAVLFILTWALGGSEGVLRLLARLDVIAVAVLAVAALFALYRYSQLHSPPAMCYLTGGHFSWLWGWQCG